MTVAIFADAGGIEVGSTVPKLLLLLLTALAVAFVARFARIPYTVGLVIAGLGISLFAGHPAIALTPDLVLVVFLPPLLFAGAWEMPTATLRENWVPVALLATVGVASGICITYALLVFGGGATPQTAAVFGAIIAATDPVAVIALFRELGVDRRLSTIVEGESLFNDGTAVVAFRSIMITTTGAFALHPLAAFGEFTAMTVGGAALGAAVGVVAALALRALDDYLIEATATIVVAYGSYLLAEALHASGIIAVIVAGLVVSGAGASMGSFSRTRESVDQFWEYAAFLANSLLFVLVGLAIDVRGLLAGGGVIVLGVVAVAIARAAIVYGLAPLSAAAGRPIPTTWQHVIALGGMRGALPMALVLSLPEDFQNRAQIIGMVYAVVLFTLVAQGLSLRPALRRSGLSIRRDHQAKTRN